MNTYLTTFDGELELISNEVVVAKISKVVTDNFNDIMNLDRQTNILYIKGGFDDTNEMIEKFISKIYGVINLPDGCVTIEAQGQDLKDRWDIVISDKGVYIQEYKLVKSNLKQYA